MARSTLGDLKDTIADDLDRSDLTDQIADAINGAIEYYQATRFYFNELRTQSFSTVAAQASYNVSDQAFFDLITEIKQITITIGGVRYDLRPVDPYEMELLQDTTAARGQPYLYAWYAQRLWLYAIPDQAYTVRVLGISVAPPPPHDSNSTNLWITEAFELIRCRAKAYLAAHLLKDSDLLQAAASAEQAALGRLLDRTNKINGTGFITPTAF